MVVVVVVGGVVVVVVLGVVDRHVVDPVAVDAAGGMGDDESGEVEHVGAVLPRVEMAQRAAFQLNKKVRRSARVCLRGVLAAQLSVGDDAVTAHREEQARLGNFSERAVELGEQPAA